MVCFCGIVIVIMFEGHRRKSTEKRLIARTGVGAVAAGLLLSACTGSPNRDVSNVPIDSIHLDYRSKAKITSGYILAGTNIRNDPYPKHPNHSLPETDMRRDGNACMNTSGKKPFTKFEGYYAIQIIFNDPNGMYVGFPRQHLLGNESCNDTAGQPDVDDIVWVAESGIEKATITPEIPLPHQLAILNH